MHFHQFTGDLESFAKYMMEDKGIKYFQRNSFDFSKIKIKPKN